jgi:hypothetical protein
MKALFLILVLLFMASLASFAQQKEDTLIVSLPHSCILAFADSARAADSSMTGFCPKSKDSCKYFGAKGKCRMKDTFIDKDNDGMNDNRCNRMGWSQKKKMGKCCRKK